MVKHVPPVDAAIEALGGPTKAAKALGVSNPSVVLNWRSREQIPARFAGAVEELTGISRYDLCPSLVRVHAKTEDAA